MPIDCDYTIVTPPGAGAVAVFALTGDIDRALAALRLPPVGIGQVVVRTLADIDAGVVARWSARSAHVTPHGGAESVRVVARWFGDAGLRPVEAMSARQAFPEAVDEVEALALAALSRVESPLAVDLLLDQPGRWRAWDGLTPSRAEVERVSAALAPLLTPPTVAAVGAPNVGKSTLTNALAERCVSIVADGPGTTRDHVGVTLDLGGLAVRWVDTPGQRGGGRAEEAEAREIARAVVLTADLVVVCGDAEHGFVLPDGVSTERTLLVATRADLGAAAAREGATVSARTSAAQGDSEASGVLALGRLVRDRLAPVWAREWEGPWAFDPSLRRPG